MNDTSEQAADIQASIQRRLGAAGRLQLAFQMSVMARDLALLRLRAQYPTWSAHQLHRELIRYNYLLSGQNGPFE